MKSVKQISRFALSLILAVFLSINFTACNEQSPLSAYEDNADTNLMTLAKKKDKNKDNGGGQLNFPISVSKKVTFNPGLQQYNGCTIKFPNGNKSKFTLDKGALTPPADVKFGEPVTITAIVDYDEDKQELVYTFGPHGCQFSQQAQIKLDYASLGVDSPTLYYIEDDGTYQEQVPDQISVNKKWLKIRVDHFSRYAVAWAK